MTSFMRVIWLAEHKMSFDSTQCFIGCYSRDVIVAGQPDKTFLSDAGLRIVSILLPVRCTALGGYLKSRAEISVSRK